MGVGTVLDHVDVDDCSHKFGTTACGYIYQVEMPLLPAYHPVQKIPQFLELNQQYCEENRTCRGAYMPTAVKYTGAEFHNDFFQMGNKWSIHKNAIAFHRWGLNC